MRENRTHGSEGGEGESPSLPLSEFLLRRQLNMLKLLLDFVVPAKAGIQCRSSQSHWIPASAGKSAPVKALH